jgi:hypothetical protein
MVEDVEELRIEYTGFVNVTVPLAARYLENALFYEQHQ